MQVSGSCDNSDDRRRISVKMFSLTWAASLALAVFACASAQAQQFSERKELPEKPEPIFEKHRPIAWLTLTAIGQAAALADATNTLRLRHQVPGWVEYDPLARPFVRLPAPAYLTVAVAFTGIISVASLKMHNSSNKWERRFWWVPQAIQIGLNTECAARTAGNIPNASPAEVRKRPAQR
jgi:hypothetical protein